MGTEDFARSTGVRYQPEEKPSAVLAAGLGLQFAVFVLVSLTLFPTIVFRTAGATDALVSWAVFASVVICGATTVLQAVRSGRIGAGYIVVTGASGAAIAVSITAVSEGGPAMLATLMVISSLLQLVLAARLSLFRKILTPTVAGTVIMLIPVSIMPVVLSHLERVPDGVPPSAAALAALVTILVITGLTLRGGGLLRLWAPAIGVVAGSVTAGFFGLYDLDRVAGASWIGLPRDEWPSLDLDFGPVFWALLPAFVLVTLIGTIQTISGTVAIQRVSWRQPRAVDYRSVQNAVTAGGLGNLLSGLAGTMPNTTLSTGASMTELTGVGARSVGLALGAWLIALAFLPKGLAVILAIPGPVIAAYVAAMMAMLFVIGMKLVIQDGIDYRKGVVAGVAFWVGVGFQNGMIFPEHVSEFAGGLLRNGMTVGGLLAILMTLFMELTEPHSTRLETELGLSVLPKLREFLAAFASRSGWGAAMADRLDAVGEETLLTLIGQDDTGEEPAPRRLLVAARKEGGGAVLEFVSAASEENLQDRIALLREQTTDISIEREVSLRLLRHLASSVRHQRYHDTDIVTVRVGAPGTINGASGRDASPAGG